VLLAIVGFAFIAALLQWRVRGAILIGIVATAVAGICLGLGHKPAAIVALPLHGQYSLAPVAGKLQIAAVLKPSFLPILLTLVLMSFLDTLGTLVGVGAAGDMLDKDGNFPEIQKPMMVDAIACIVAPLIGTSTSGAFIESAAGIKEGARTGLAAIVVAVLFAASAFFIPLAEPLQQLSFAYGPALIVVGLMMMADVRNVKFDDATELVPAFATIVMMIFTYNIANGLTAGLVLHPLMKLIAGRWREIRAGGVVLAAVCVVYYVWGLPH
jgi:AGZA family xanthine/uracil permease-like MFS transporter